MRRIVTAVALGAWVVGCSTGTPPVLADPGRGWTTDDGGGTTVDSGRPGVDASMTVLPDAGALDVLFLGNSYTFVNDLPGTLALLASSSRVPPAIHVSSVTVAGATLQQLWQGPDAQAAIAKGGLTHVVLQEQSETPLIDPALFSQYAGLFAAAARKVGAMPTFYETWARNDGDAVYMQPWSGGTPGAMQDGLFAAYSKAATDSAGLLVPAGEAWRAVRALGTIPLFQSDGSHPLVSGTYLTACVFYVKLTSHAVPAGAALPAGLDAASAATLRDAALAAAVAH